MKLLLPYQQRWIADRSQVRVWEKSRRIGASWVRACEAAIDGLNQTGGCDTWYTSYNKPVTAEFIRDVAMWAKSITGIAHPWVTDEVKINGYVVLQYSIRFATGYRTTALSSKSTDLRSRRGRAVIDEAAHMPDLDAAIGGAMAITMWGGTVDFLSTHYGVENPFNILIEDIRAGRQIGMSVHRTTLDDALREGLHKRICLVNGEEWSQEKQDEWRSLAIHRNRGRADEELFLIPRRGGSAFIRPEIIESCMVDTPVFRFEPPQGFALLSDEKRSRYMLTWLNANLGPALTELNRNLMHFLGEDFGRVSDLTVFAPIAIEQNMSRSVPFLVELRNTPYREQEIAFKYVCDRLPRFTYAALDDTGNGQYLAERAQQKYGEKRIEKVHLSDKWYGENLPKLRAAFEDSVLSIPRDADVLSDLSLLKVIDGIPKLPKTKTAEKTGGTSTKTRHGDSAIAIALGYYASMVQGPAYEYTGGGRRENLVGKSLGVNGGFRGMRGSIL